MSWRFKASKYKNAAPVEQKKELQLRNLSIGSFTGTVAALLERFFKELFYFIQAIDEKKNSSFSTTIRCGFIFMKNSHFHMGKWQETVFFKGTGTGQRQDRQT